MPRLHYTGDLDIFVAISERNAKALVRVFADFGFSDIGLAEADFLDEEIIVEIGREPLKLPLVTCQSLDVFGSTRPRLQGSSLFPFSRIKEQVRTRRVDPQALNWDNRSLGGPAVAVSLIRSRMVCLRYRPRRGASGCRRRGATAPRPALRGVARRSVGRSRARGRAHR